MHLLLNKARSYCRSTASRPDCMAAAVWNFPSDSIANGPTGDLTVYGSAASSSRSPTYLKHFTRQSAGAIAKSERSQFMKPLTEINPTRPHGGEKEPEIK